MSEQERQLQAIEDATQRLIGDSGIFAYLVCGSGIGPQLLENPEAWGFELEAQTALPELGMPGPSVPGHAAQLLLGRVGGRRVVVQSGRLHPYEGHSAQLCTAVLAACLARGVARLFLTCACGGVDPRLAVGELVLLRDQLNLWGPTALKGPEFVDCATLYPARERERVQELAKAELGQALTEVVYAYARGPQYETPAEVELIRRLGGEVVGMSTTYEAVLAAKYKTPVVGLGIVTNGAGVEGLSHREVEEVAQRSRSKLMAVLKRCLAAAP